MALGRKKKTQPSSSSDVVEQFRQLATDYCGSPGDMSHRVLALCDELDKQPKPTMPLTEPALET